jgi:pyridoxine 5-phosphate synthase
MLTRLESEPNEEPRIMPELCVNIDHVATVRQARRTYEPDPVQAAIEAEAGGADGITVHLREDRRHIQDADLPRIKEVVRTKLNLEMGATEEMIRIAIGLKPQLAMFVPESRQEITTEGGLDIAGQESRIREAVARLKGAGIPVSAFIDAQERQIAAAARAGFDFCEIHTGPYAHAFHDHPGGLNDPRTAAELALAARTAAEFALVGRAAELVVAHSMQANAGHALNYANVAAIAAIPGLRELHIGHAIVSRALFVGLRAAVAQMQLSMRAH